MMKATTGTEDMEGMAAMVLYFPPLPAFYELEDYA